jgi:hypothetical protein
MTANVFGFHDGISGANGSLDDFTSYLDSSGNFYLGSGSSDAQFVWDNISKELLVSGSNARIEVDKFFVGTKKSQYISGSNGNIEISSSNFHLSPNGDVTMQGTITANAGTIGGFNITDDALSSNNFFISGSATGNERFISSTNFNVKANGDVTASALNLTGGNVGGLLVTNEGVSVGEILKFKNDGQITGSNVLFEGGRIGGYTIDESNLNALRLAEEFTPIPTTDGEIIYGTGIPAEEIDNRAEILIGNTIYGINTIGAGKTGKEVSVTLDSATYINSSDFTIFYSGSEVFNAGTVKFESISYTSGTASEPIYALTSSIVSSERTETSPYFNIFDKETNKILSTVAGVDSLIFEVPVSDLRGWKSGTFAGYFFTTQEEERFRFWPDNSNLELYLSSDIEWFNALNTNGDISSAELWTIENNLFLYSPEIAERGGVRPEEWYDKLYNEIIQNGPAALGLESIPIYKPIPVLGAASKPINKFNSQIFPNQANSTLNYNPGYWFSVFLEPGYFINPEVIAILSNINAPTIPAAGGGDPKGDGGGGSDNLSSPNTWWEIENIVKDVSLGVGAPFKLMHTYVELVQIPSTNLRLNRAVWPTDIAESGTIPIAGPPLNSLIGATGRTTPVNITSRISSTEVATDLTIAQLRLLYGGTTYPNYSSIPYQSYQSEYEAVKSFISKDNPIGRGVNSFLPKISVGELSGSFREKVTFQISGSGVISSSKFYVDELGNISGSTVNFIGGVISGSDLTLVADTFQFGNPSSGATIQGGGGTMIISSSLFSLTENALSMKGNLRANSAYMQDTYMGGKVISTGVLNPNTQGVRYQIPFIEVYSTSSTDARFTSTAYTSSVFQGSHGSWVLSSVLSKTPQMLTKTPADGVEYPDEFKAWFDISGVNTDYKYISDFQILDVDSATSILTKENINNQFILNRPLTPNTSSTAFATMTSEFINIAESLPDHSTNAHLQFAIRGTTHPYSGSFVGFYPEYLIQIVSGSDVFYSRQYRDENACNHDWTIIDVPISDVLRVDATNTTETTIKDEFKVQIGMRYSGSAATGTITGTSKGLGWALTEMRLVEPVRAASLDTQTIHFKDTYFTSDGKLSTAHKGNLIPLIQSQSNIVSASFALGSPSRRWKDAYFGLSENNIVSSSDDNVENKLVRIDIHSGRLSYTTASIGGGAGGGGGSGGSYTHPTHPGDDINIDTGVLTGATVISDLDFNITTDTLGHVTDANATIATRTLTLSDLGYNGATDANNYSLPEATATTRGGIELFSNTDQSVAANAVTSTASRTYGIQLNSAGQAVVNVPWSDTNTNTTYSAGTGLTLVGTEFRNAAPDQTVSLTGAGATTISGTYPNFTITSTDTNTDTNTITSIRRDNTGTYRTGDINLVGGSNVTITETSAGVFSFASTDTNTNTTYSAGTGLTLKNTTFSLTDTYDNYQSFQIGAGKTYTDVTSGAKVTLVGGNGVTISNEAGTLTISADSNTAYSAGSGLDLIGTTFSHSDTSTQDSVNNSGRTYIQDITLDAYGHITGITSATETVVNTDTNTQRTDAEIRAVTSKQLVAGDNVTFKVEGETITITSTDTNTDTNTTYTAGTGLTLVGTEFRNSAPDQTVSLTGKGATSISGTYPNFTITSTDTNTDTNTTYTAGTGLKLFGTEFRNSAPDQTVSLTGKGATTISGEYPNFTITSTDTNTDTNTITTIGTKGVIPTAGDFTFVGAGATTITQEGGNIIITSTDTNTDTNTTYSAGTGLTLVGTEFSNEAPDQTVTLTGAGATTISGKYPNFTITSTDTNTDTNTTYSAGNGITLSGTTFSHSDTSTQTSVNNSGRTYIQDITLDTYGHITGIVSATETVVNTDTNTVTQIGTDGVLPAPGDFTFVGKGATSIFQEGGKIYVSSTDTNTDTNTTYTADGNYGLTLSGTTFRLEDDRRRNSTTTDIYSGNTHDFTWYDADVGIRWYTAGAEEMRLQDDGTLHVDGDVVAYSTTVSDERLKDNVTTIQNPLDKIKALRGVEYEWNAGNRKGKRDLGLIAQEVEMVIPEIVHEHELPLIDGESGTIYKTVDYEKMVAVLIEGMKEQQTIINKLEQRIVTLESGSKN